MDAGPEPLEGPDDWIAGLEIKVGAGRQLQQPEIRAGRQPFRFGNRAAFEGSFEDDPAQAGFPRRFDGGRQGGLRVNDAQGTDAGAGGR